MPVTIHTSSPINATKASGSTPQTAQPKDQGSQTSQVPATTTSAVSQQEYPPAQPGATPSLPVPTGAPQASFTSLTPTPTQNVPEPGPPAPQPGAVPVPRGMSTSPIPPPPKAGQTVAQSQAATMPPQMSYPAPSGSQYAPGGSYTTTALGPQQASIPLPGPTSIQESGMESLSHPPGYHQNTHASELSRDQRAAHHASMSNNNQGFGDDGDDEGLWSTAKKWAVAAGDGLAAAENEVWKRINKD